MKLTKKKLIQAVRPGLEKLGYLYLKDSVSGAQGLFGKKLPNGMYLTLGGTIHRFYDDAFTGDFYLSKTTENAACWGDIPKDCYERPGYFLSKEELASMNEKSPDIWWSGFNEESVSSFIEVVNKAEPRFLAQEGLMERIEQSSDVNMLYTRSLKVKELVLKGEKLEGSFEYLPQRNVDDIPMDWFKAAEIVIRQRGELLHPRIVKGLAADAYRQHILDKNSDASHKYEE